MLEGTLAISVVGAQALGLNPLRVTFYHKFHFIVPCACLVQFSLNDVHGVFFFKHHFMSFSYAGTFIYNWRAIYAICILMYEMLTDLFRIHPVTSILLIEIDVMSPGWAAFIISPNEVFSDIMDLASPPPPCPSVDTDQVDAPDRKILNWSLKCYGFCRYPMR